MDISGEFYKKWVGLKNKKVRLTLKNKTILNGYLMGYFKGDFFASDSYIYRWHLVSNQDDIVGYDSLGYINGILIYQSEIAEVWFEEDNTTFYFDSKE